MLGLADTEQFAEDAAQIVRRGGNQIASSLQQTRSSSASAAGVTEVREAPFDSSLRRRRSRRPLGRRSGDDCGRPPGEIRRLVGPAPIVLLLGFRNVGSQAHDSHSSNGRARWPWSATPFDLASMPAASRFIWASSRCRPSSGCRRVSRGFPQPTPGRSSDRPRARPCTPGACGRLSSA